MNLGNRKAISAAKEIIEQLNIRKPSEILIEEIAWTLGITITNKPLQGSIARLLRIGEEAIIRVSNRVKEGGQRRFAIAHEVGHFKLHKSTSQVETCNNRDIATWNGECGHEAEANSFASELLMPEKLFADKCDVSKVSFDEILPIAKEFQTSLTATTLRFVQFCPESCAIIVSEGGKIKWHMKSSYCKSWINNGIQLDKRTLAYEYFADRNIPENMEEIDAEAWLSSHYGKNEIWEHSIAMPSYNAVLTLLWIPVD